MGNMSSISNKNVDTPPDRGQHDDSETTVTALVTTDGEASSVAGSTKSGKVRPKR